MGIFFVRERGRVRQGEGRPRFELVAVSGVDLKVYHSHLRKSELERLAAELEAQVIFLPRGEGEGDEAQQPDENRGRKRRRSGPKLADDHE